jgi:hypothetical protein
MAGPSAVRPLIGVAPVGPEVRRTHGRNQEANFMGTVYAMRLYAKNCVPSPGLLMACVAAHGRPWLRDSDGAGCQTRETRQLAMHCHPAILSLARLCPENLMMSPNVGATWDR